ncbi:MAG: NAD(P)H-dependent oxidoreductase [Acidimicrobiia bacterium]
MSALVVHAHPCAGSYTAALRDAVRRGLEAVGDTVDLIDLWADGFDPLEPEDVLAGERHIERLRAASTLVLVYPTWWSGQPAILTGWLSALPIDALRSIGRVVAVTAHGSSKWLNVLEGETGRRIVKHTLLRRCAPGARAEWHAFYGIDYADEPRRAAFVAKVERELSRRR